MKKLKVLALVIVSCLFLTACSCQRKVENFTVSFNSDGGTTVETVTVEDGKTIQKPSNPTKEGYTFKGWYSSEDSEHEFDFSKPITGNITLVAKWEKKNACTLTCDPGYKLVNGDSADCSCKKINTSTGTTTTEEPTEEPVVPELTDKEKLAQALTAIVPKTLTDGNTSIKDYTIPSGCTITNTANVTSTDKTVVTDGVVKTLYRANTDGTIKSTYKVECGSESDNKTVTHTVPKSTYSYEYEMKTAITYLISVYDGETLLENAYTLSNSKAQNLKYNADAKGAQVAISAFKSDEAYSMTLGSKTETVYEVAAPELR